MQGDCGFCLLAAHSCSLDDVIGWIAVHLQASAISILAASIILLLLASMFELEDAASASGSGGIPLASSSNCPGPCEQGP